MIPVSIYLIKVDFLLAGWGEPPGRGDLNLFVGARILFVVSQALLSRKIQINIFFKITRFQ